MKFLIKTAMLLTMLSGTALAQVNNNPRAALCPQGTVPLLDDVTEGEAKFKGTLKETIKVGETKTFCFPIRNPRSYLFFTGNDFSSNNTQKTISAELIVNGQPVKAYDLGAGFKDILSDVREGIYLVKVTGVLAPSGNCNSTPSLCKEAMTFRLLWRTMEVDNNIKVACPRDTIEVATYNAAGWYLQKTNISGGKTFRFCARLNDPSYGFEAGWGSYTQVRCGFKHVRVSSLTYPNFEAKEVYTAEGGVRYQRPMKPQAMLIEVAVDQPEMQNCTEYGNVSWRYR